METMCDQRLTQEVGGFIMIGSRQTSPNREFRIKSILLVHKSLNL
jgi:hypothetical protein